MRRIVRRIVICGFFLVAPIFSRIIFAEENFMLPEITKPFEILVDDNKLYVAEEKEVFTYSFL